MRNNLFLANWQDNISLGYNVKVQKYYYNLAVYRVFKLDLHQNKRSLGHQKCTKLATFEPLTSTERLLTVSSPFVIDVNVFNIINVCT